MKSAFRVLITLLIFTLANYAQAAQITLKKSFVDKFKDEVLIHTKFTIDAVPPNGPHGISEAGRTEISMFLAEPQRLGSQQSLR